MMIRAILVAAVMTVIAQPVMAGELSGKIGFGSHLFPNNARDGFDGRSSAAGAQVEYTLVGLLGDADLGAVAKGQYDSRNAPTFSDNDSAIGERLILNDAQNTDVLAFTSIDTDNGSRFTSVETNRRGRNSGEIRLETRFFNNVDAANPLFALRRDDYIQVEYVHFF